MNKRIVVLGSTGMAGHVIAKFLTHYGYDIYKISKSEHPGLNSYQLDVTNFTLLEETLKQINPDIIINAIGALIKQSQNDQPKTVLLNAYLPKWLEQLYKKTQTKIIHISTDCVFSGSIGNYKENDFKDGDTFYDRTKSLGEIVNDKDLTFRMSIIGPEIKNGEGLFHWFMNQKGSINGYTKAFWNGITTIELAKGIKCAIEQNLTGLYHLVPDKNIDKYNLLCLFKKYSQKNIDIVPYSDVFIDKTLINTRTDFDYKVSGYEQQVREMFEWIEKNTKIYNY